MAYAQVVQAAGEHVNEQIGGYEAEGGLEQAEAIGALPQFLEDVQAGLARMAGNMHDGPFSAAARDLIEELASRVGGLSDHAVQAHQQFERDHAPELLRLREPRVDERQWDTTAPGNQ